MRSLLISVGICILLSLASPAQASPLGDRVVDYCRSHVGERVGNGQCAGLATQALRAAGAKRRAGPDAPGRGDYVWGRPLLLVEATPDGPHYDGLLSDIQPGDIIQYRHVRFVTMHAEHHTAVVASVDVEHGDVAVYQQNIGHRQFVTEGVVHLRNLSQGWLRIYRPLPRR